MAERVASSFGRFVQQLTYSLEVFEPWNGVQDFVQHIADKAGGELKRRGEVVEEDEEYDEQDDEEEEDEGYDEEEEDGEEQDEGHDEERDEGHDRETDGGHESEVSAHEQPDSSAPKRLPPCFPVHTFNNYTTYELLKKEQKEILDEGKVLTHLCDAFKTMPNIKRVVFTKSWRKPDQCWCEQVANDAVRRSYKPWQTMLSCTEEVCNFVEGHKHLCVKPQSSYDNPRESRDWWKDLMLALEKTDKVLQELVMEIPRGNDVADDVIVHMEVFEPSYGLSEIIPNIFSKLTRLELSLDTYAETDINRALLDAKALEILHISIANLSWEDMSEDFDQSEFSTLLSGCTFPNLHSLSLGRFTANEEEILEFVRRSPDLRCLVLRKCRLRGHWVPLVQSLRDETNLQSLELDYVLGMFDVDGRIGELDDNENYLGPDLQNFFYSEKHSPFPEEFIKKHVEFRDYMDKEMGKWFDHFDLSVGEGVDSNSQSE